MQKFEKYVKKAKKMGVKDARIIPADSVVTAEWVRIKCTYGCGGYGRSLTCPPHTPTPEQTSKMLSSYKHALLIHVDENVDIDNIVLTLEQECFFDGYFKAFGMGAGPCSLCEKCPKICTYPHNARPSMEACGIDVFSTVRKHKFPIEVLRTRKCKFNYYGLILIE